MKRVAVITSSDKGYRGEREDLSGPAVKEIMEAAGYEVVSVDVLPDDRGMLGSRMAEIADLGLAELILTTGGTGFSQRDVTRCAACSAASLICCHSRQLACGSNRVLGGSSYTRLSTAAPLTSPYWPCLRWAGCWMW